MEQILSSLPPSWLYALDLATFAFCALILGGYQIRLQHRIQRNPTITVQGMNAQARAAWVRRVMTEKGMEVMAVQTFRNSTMAATLMASTAVLLIFGILNMMVSADKIGPVFHSLNTWGAHAPLLWIFKLMLALVDFFIAFFSFSLAVRGYHHAGYLVNVPMDRVDHGVTVDRVIHLMNRTGQYYSTGMRTYYFSVPLVLWLFGPLWMLISTLALLAVLNHLDHLAD